MLYTPGRDTHTHTSTCVGVGGYTVGVHRYILHTERAVMACARFSSDGRDQKKRRRKTNNVFFVLFFFFFFSLGCVTSSQSTAGTKLALIYGTFIRLGFTSFPLSLSLPCFFSHFLIFSFLGRERKDPKIKKNCGSFPSIVCKWSSSWNDRESSSLRAARSSADWSRRIFPTTPRHAAKPPRKKKTKRKKPEIEWVRCV